MNLRIILAAAAFSLLMTAPAAVKAQDEVLTGAAGKISYVPQVFGAVKAKLELSGYDGQHRFNVRNSRIGVKGNVSEFMKYTIQIDFSNEGKLSIMDSYVTFDPGRWEVSLGQQQYKFSTDLDRGPNTNWFANRSFISKYLTNYYGISAAGVDTYSIGSRDLGIHAAYTFDIPQLPLKLSGGIFNGTGANNPEWTQNVNAVIRLDVGYQNGFGGALSHYNGYTPTVTWEYGTANFAPRRHRMILWGGEMHYAGDDFRFEAEYAQRRLNVPADQVNLLHAAHLQGYYQFRMVKNRALDYIAPVARWDYINGLEYDNLFSAARGVERLDANRATIGLNLGFVKKFVGSELRFNYEKYLFKNKPSDISVNRLFQDKFTIEVVATF